MYIYVKNLCNFLRLKDNAPDGVNIESIMLFRIILKDHTFNNLPDFF